MIEIEAVRDARNRRQSLMDTRSEGAYQGAERRSRPRIYDGFPVRVWAVDTTGDKFEVEVPSQNLSASGLCVRLPREVEVGGEIAVLVQFSTSRQGTRPRVAAVGTVIRSATLGGSDGNEWETAVRFSGHVVV